jgi:hypothetical protein
MALCMCGIAKSQTLIWSDEFNGTAVDLTKWGFETGTGPNGDWGTCQVDAATSRPENVGIQTGVTGADGGCLRITTRKETYTVKGRNGGTRNYTSARVISRDKAFFGPGHKLRARVWPRDVRYIGQGFAFWAMPNEIPPGETTLAWPQGGEIDIMEYNGLYPYNNLGTVHFANAWANNRWLEGNHRNLGSFYSYETQQVPTESPQWIYVDLGSSVTINRVVLRWETAYGKAYQVQVSNDAVNWTSIYSTANGDGGVDDLAVAGTGRYVRMYATVRGTQWGYSLWEFEVYRSGTTANQALNKPAFSSTNENQTTFLPSKAVDGSTSTRWASGSPDANVGPLPPSPTNPFAGSSNWHVYGIDWYADHIDFVVDELIYHTHYFNDGGAFSADGADQKEVRVVNGRRITYSEYSNHFSEWHPFEHKFFLIMSAGVGGSCTYGGAIVPEAIFPASVFIDWVRVYTIDGAARLATAVTSEAHDDSEFRHGYPNPVRDVYHMPGISDGTPVRILDLSGKPVARAIVKDHTIDISDLTTGMYILRVSDKNRIRTIKMYKE